MSQSYACTHVNPNAKTLSDVPTILSLGPFIIFCVHVSTSPC